MRRGEGDLISYLSRRHFLIAGGAVAGTSLLAPRLFADPPRGGASRTNIVFLLADDLCCYALGCYGNRDVKTPNIDALARDGLTFDHHYDTTPICMASRANIMTGKYEYETGCNFEHGDMKPEIWRGSYPVLLRRAGYFTAFAGKFGFEVDGKGICADDFDLYGGSPGQTKYQTAENKTMAGYAAEYPHSTRAYGAFGQDAIKKGKQSGKPFCLSISFKAPHRPVQPDPAFDAIYKGKRFTKPANFGREHGRHLSEQSRQGRQYKLFDKWKYDTDYDRVMAKYHQLVYGIDVAVGMIRDELERQGVADNTVIIFTSDNGYICGSHGYASKVLPMEEASRVPLIIVDPRAPRTTRGKRTDALTGNIDFAPTMLALAGVRPFAAMSGVSLAPLLRDPSAKVRDQLAIINTFGATPTMSLSVVDERYKYTWWWYAGEGMRPTEELFDLQEDRLEMKNLAPERRYARVLQQMRSRYDRELAAWKKRVVPYNDYERFGVLFDRQLDWSEKQGSLKSGGKGKRRGRKR